MFDHVPEMMLEGLTLYLVVDNDTHYDDYFQLFADKKAALNEARRLVSAKVEHYTGCTVYPRDTSDLEGYCFLESDLDCWQVEVRELKVKV